MYGLDRGVLMDMHLGFLQVPQGQPPEARRVAGKQVVCAEQIDRRHPPGHGQGQFHTRCTAPDYAHGLGNLLPLLPAANEVGERLDREQLHAVIGLFR
ncbi:MAG TPA: hypothetical protein DEQ55_07020, partial [Pseudomonas sp.]|nr:hypothetical protein [Pseudomonas sp.]